MLQDYFEPFLRMDAVPDTDLTGVPVVRYEAGESFSAALCDAPGMTDAPAGITAARHTPVLLHPRKMTFMPGDVVQRVSDGARYRVLDCSDFMRTPPGALTAFAQVTLERVVTAHD